MDRRVRISNSYADVLTEGFGLYAAAFGVFLCGARDAGTHYMGSIFCAGPTKISMPFPFLSIKCMENPSTIDDFQIGS